VPDRPRHPMGEQNSRDEGCRFHDTLGGVRFAPPNKEASHEDRIQLSGAE
jgi:hypothetical protein